MNNHFYSIRLTLSNILVSYSMIYEHFDKQQYFTERFYLNDAIIIGNFS